MHLETYSFLMEICTSRIKIYKILTAVEHIRLKSLLYGRNYVVMFYDLFLCLLSSLAFSLFISLHFMQTHLLMDLIDDVLFIYGKKKKVSIGWGKIIPVFHCDDLMIHCWCQMKVITRTLDKVLSLYETTYAPTNLYLENIIFLCSLTKLITIFVKFLFVSFHFCVFSLVMWLFQVKLKELLQTGFQPLWML